MANMVSDEFYIADRQIRLGLLPFAMRSGSRTVDLIEIENESGNDVKFVAILIFINDP